MANNNNIDVAVFQVPDGTITLPTWNYIMNQISGMMNTIITDGDSINEDLKTMDSKLASWAGSDPPTYEHNFDPSTATGTLFQKVSDMLNERTDVIDSMKDNLNAIEAIGGGGVGEWIPVGTQYTYDGSTYTVGTNVERFNVYGDEGYTCNQAAGDYSHVEGLDNKALGKQSHAEGGGNVTTGWWSHVEGSGNIIRSDYGHAEGSTNTVTASCSHAEGFSNDVSGQNAHVEGGDCLVSGSYGHGEGYRTTSTGQSAHAEGYQSLAEGQSSHAEGTSYAHGECSHAEGYSVKNTTTPANSTGSMGDYSHTEGYNCIANGNCSHAEGQETTATGTYSHAEGYGTKAQANYSHAEGNLSLAEGLYSHAECRSYAAGQFAHSEGYSVKDTTTPANSTGALAEYSHTEGYNCIASGTQGSHAEGYRSKAIGTGTHAEGYQTQAIGNYSHTEGYSNLCVPECAHVEGQQNQITTPDSSYGHIEGRNNLIAGSITGHAEGDNNKLLNGANRAHVEGYDNIITGDTTIQGAGSWESHCEGRSNYIFHSYRAHCEGQTNKIYVSNWAHNEGNENTINRKCSASHAEGMRNTIGDALGNSAACAHVQGDNNTATANCASATGYHTTANAINSTTMGYYTRTDGIYSVAMGDHTIASARSQFVLGEYNVSNSSIVSKTGVSGYYYTLAKFPFIIGNGYIDDPFAETVQRSDAFKIDCDGKIYVRNHDGIDVSDLCVYSNDDGKVLTASYQNGVGTFGWAPASSGGECVIVTDTSTSLPNKVVIENNHEYRYLSLTSASTITISIETIDTSKSFYSSIVLHNISTSSTLSSFVTVSGDSVISNIVFLNESNVDLTTADTVEMLFFTNGMANSVMCIAYAYSSATPAPVYPDDKILVIELDSNHDDTNVIAEHTTLASAKSDLNTKYSTDNTKLYKLYVGDNVTTDSTDIPSVSYGLFEDTHNLYSAVLGECIHSLGGTVFRNCENLTEVSLPETNMGSITGYNFTGTNLPSLTIPSGCQYLRIAGQVDAIFFGNNLSDLTFDTNGTVYLANDGQGSDDPYSDDGGVFGQASYRDNTSDYSKPLTITFSENVTGIVANSGGYLFGWDAGNITINISNSVTSISSAFLVGVGDLHGTVTVNIDNTSGSITDPNNDNWGAGSTLPANCTINYLRQ